MFVEDLFCLLVHHFGDLKDGEAGGCVLLWGGFTANAGVEVDAGFGQLDEIGCCEDVGVDAVAEFGREGEILKCRFLCVRHDGSHGVTEV